MVGQDKLQKKLDSYDMFMFPQSNLLIGEYGCGKHTLVEMACSKLCVEYIDISDEVSHELIDELYLSPQRVAYVIDINELSKKHRYVNQENALLKFIEEPPMLSTIFILVEYEEQAIDTIKNRCVLWRFAPYTENDLTTMKPFSNKDVYQLLNTPGRVLNSNDEKYYDELFKICNSVILNIGKANVSNTLSLEKHLSFNDGDYPFELFLNCLRTIARKEYVVGGDKKVLDKYLVIREYIDRLHVLNVSERNLFYDFILNLKDTE